MDAFGISIVIVNWNSEGDLRDCLASLTTQTDRDFETIVVDNGSVDGSCAMVKREFPHVVLVETGENLGFAEGCNRGIAIAEHSWLGMLNNDTVADRAFIAELRASAKRAGPRVGTLQARLVFKKHPDRTNSTGILLARDATAKDRDFDVPLREADGEGEIFCATAGAALYRRAMLEEIRLSTGFFDRGYFMYYEDVDIGWRARIAGWSAIYVPTAVVQHAFQGSSKRHGDRRISIHMKRNRLRTLVKNGSFRFFARAIPKTLYDLAEAVVWRGPGMIGDFYSAARGAQRVRREVDRMARVPRCEIEARWVQS